jgi:hypothetical protein
MLMDSITKSQAKSIVPDIDFKSLSYDFTVCCLSVMVVLIFYQGLGVKKGQSNS